MFQSSLSFFVKNRISLVFVLIGLSLMYRCRCHEEVLNKDCGAKVILWEIIKSRLSRGVGKNDERMGVIRT